MNIDSNGNFDLLGYSRRVGTLAVFGTFDGATVALEASFDSGNTWIPVLGMDGSTAITFTDNGYANFMIGTPHLRLAVSGGTAPALKAKLTEIQNSWR